MNQVPPPWFESIRAAAQARWDMLEADPDLAGPWHQLFRQVQSPRHVLSELLQNADDAGATWAGARITNDGVFLFEHNGEDFDESSFQSLCRFGFSNKRQLHTIGFRGIGFKSTFSLGKRVTVSSANLSCTFEDHRFTQPIWVTSDTTRDHTSISVTIADDAKLKQMHAELRRWTSSPVPLLFFRSIEMLRLGNDTITKKVEGPGPVPGSTWVMLVADKPHRVLHLISPAENFPNDATEEIRAERSDREFVLPPCQVEIVLGMREPQRVYAILPTEVELGIPFSCNAPFVQDPARTGIKQPSMSVTNRWLLARVGRLAADTLVKWIADGDLPTSERVEAYELAPVPTNPNGSISSESTRAIVEEFQRSTAERDCVLIHTGGVVPPRKAIDVPTQLHNVWSGQTILDLFGKPGIFLFEPTVPPRIRDRLVRLGWIELVRAEDVAARLMKLPRPPRPPSDEGLEALWTFLQARVSREESPLWRMRAWAIVPINGKPNLAPADGAFVLGSKDPRISPDDWSFLTSYYRVVDPEWVRRLAEYDPATDLRPSVAYELFQRLGLALSVSIQQVVDAIATSIFKNPSSLQSGPNAEGVRLAQIAASVDAQINDGFHFLCLDGTWRDVSDGLLCNTSAFGDLLPESWLQTRTVSQIYYSGRGRSDEETWRRWAAHEEKSRLRAFPIPQCSQQDFGSNSFVRAQAFCIERGGSPPNDYPHRRRNSVFGTTDYDFDNLLWMHWHDLATDDPHLWTRLVAAILATWSDTHRSGANALVQQLIASRLGFRRLPLEHGNFAASWLHRLRSLPCLPDTFGRPRLPSELLRSTSETALLVDVEPFVSPDFDRPVHVEALDLLGVRSQAANPDKLIVRLRALSQSENPPIGGLTSLYRALDRITVRVSTEVIPSLRDVFTREALIWTNEGTWQTITGVYQENSEDFPNVATIHAAVSDLALWSRLGMGKRPTLEIAIKWLQNLAFGTIARGEDRERIRVILRRAPDEVWRTCNAWLDLSGRWERRANLSQSARTHSLGENLFLHYRQRTTDLSMLDANFSNADIARELPGIEPKLEWRVMHASPVPHEPPRIWMAELGGFLARLAVSSTTLESSSAEYIEQDRATGGRLQRTRWNSVRTLRVAAHLDGLPVGLERDHTVVWSQETLYVCGSPSSCYDDVVREVSRVFRSSQAKGAVSACVDRDAQWIASYVREHLNIDPAAASIDREPERTETNPNTQVHSQRVVAPAVAMEDSVEEPDTESAGDQHRGRRRRADHVDDKFQRFANALGYQWNEVRHAYVNERSGELFVRAPDLNVWNHFSPKDDEIARYWISAATLEEGFDVSADVWEYLNRRPDDSNVIITRNDDELEIERWADLQTRSQRGNLDVFATGYRIRSVSALSVLTHR